MSGLQRPVALRPATSDDAETVAEIWRAGWRDGHLGNVPDTLVHARTDASFSTRTRERIPATTVATVGGRVVGFIMVAGAEVEQVYVAAEHRGTGVAPTLLSEAERQVRAGGHRIAWLAVVAGNGRARRFYAGHGWVDEGRFDHQAPGPDGVIAVPAHRYVKAL